ncbi:MAG TPA: Gfo/Idh/MocA family oxidoreductase, partial [Halanaerobiales bacterium]|nr:Gfo/Idh/MocA family oxidoreductase [Halanaerobiales bacterium]
MVNKKLKVGIIGCGDIANYKHMPALKELSDLCEMTSFCDIRINRAVKAAEEFGIKDSKVYE